MPFALILAMLLGACGGGGGVAAGSNDGFIGPTPLATQAIHADIPFAEYASNIAVQALGEYPLMNSISDSIGLNGPTPVLGSPLRFGKVNDPKGVLIKGAVRKVLRLAVRSDDPPTAGTTAIRVDAVMPNGIVNKDTIYWAAFEVYVPALTYYANDDMALVNIHPADGEIAGNWTFSLARGVVTYSRVDPLRVLNTYARISSVDAPPDNWLKFVVKFRLSNGSAGFNQTWIDKGSGLVQVVNDFGANSPLSVGDYMKMAFYNYSWLDTYGDYTRPQREVFYRSLLSPIKDSGQTPAQIAALLV